MNCTAWLAHLALDYLVRCDYAGIIYSCSLREIRFTVLQWVNLQPLRKPESDGSTARCTSSLQTNEIKDHSIYVCAASTETLWLRDTKWILGNGMSVGKHILDVQHLKL